MNIYIVTQGQGRKYSPYDGAVIVAETEEEAKEFFNEEMEFVNQHSDEDTTYGEYSFYTADINDKSVWLLYSTFGKVVAHQIGQTDLNKGIINAFKQ